MIAMKNPLLCVLMLLSSPLLDRQARGQEFEIRNLPLQLIEDVDVASLDSGIVNRVHVKPGDRVTRGTLLLELDRELHQGEADVKKMACLVAEAEASNDVNLRYSQKTLLLNGKVLEKSQNAVAAFPKSISETEIDRLKLERDQSELSIEQAQLQQEVASLTAQLRREEKTLADIQLERRSLVAPLDGMVVAVEVQPGEAVVGGKPVLRIVSLGKLRVIASVDRRFAFKIPPGSPAFLAVQDDEKEWVVGGKVVFVSPEIRFTEQTFDVWVEIDNADERLLPGMKGTLQIAVEPRPNHPA